MVPFETAIAGKWGVSAGANAGENINVMLNSDGVTATVVFTNNAGDLVLRVMEVHCKFIQLRQQL